MRQQNKLQRLFPDFEALGLFLIMISMLGLLAVGTANLTETLLAGFISLYCVRGWRDRVENERQA